MASVIKSIEISLDWLDTSAENENIFDSTLDFFHIGFESHKPKKNKKTHGLKPVDKA